MDWDVEKCDCGVSSRYGILIATFSHNANIQLTLRRFMGILKMVIFVVDIII